MKLRLVNIFVLVAILCSCWGCQQKLEVGSEDAKLLDSQGPTITFERLVHDFGKVGPKTHHNCTLEFRNSGDGVLKIDEITHTCGCTPYDLDKMEYQPGETGALTVGLHTHEPLGPVTKQLHVLSNATDNSDITLTIKAIVEEKVRYEPKRLRLSMNKENAGCPEIMLYSLDDIPFEIKQFNSTENCMMAQVNTKEKEAAFVLQPLVDVETLREDPRGRIRITLTHPECKAITIPFEAMPEYKVTPQSIVVSKARPERPVIRELEIFSNYDEDFDLESISADKNMIKVLSHEQTNGRHKLRLEIMPPAAKPKSRSFKDILRLNIKEGPQLEIRCLGFYSKS